MTNNTALSEKIGSTENQRHRFDFNRDDPQYRDAPLRPAPNSISRYIPLYEEYRRRQLCAVAYKIKTSAEEFAPYQELLNKWDDLEWEGDPVGDDIAKMFRDLPSGKGRKLFEQCLNQGIDSIENPPQALLSLSAELDKIPTLFDMPKVQRAADKLADLPLFVHYTANISSFLIASNTGSVARMVGGSGRFLDIKNSLNRFIETSRYVLGDVSSENVFQAGSDSLKNGTRVRIMHSLIRNHAMNSDNKEIFDYENRGNPIPRKSSAYGGVVFVMSPMFLNQRLGGRSTAQDFDDARELGNLLSYINGAHYDTLPKNMDELCLLADQFGAFHEGNTPFAKELNQALFEMPDYVVEQQQSLLAKALLSLAKPVMKGLFQWTHGDQIMVEVNGMPKKSVWAPYIFPVFAVCRRGYDICDSALPNYSARRLRRRAMHREITKTKFNQIIAKLLHKAQSEETELSYDAHDNTSVADLSGPKSA